MRRFLIVGLLLLAGCSNAHLREEALERKRQKGRLTPEERQDKPAEAAAYYASRRAIHDAEETLPAARAAATLPADATDSPMDRYAAARRQMLLMNRHSTADNAILPSAADQIRGVSDWRAVTNGQPGVASNATVSQQAVGNWAFLGPGNIGGRTRVLLIDPQNPQIMYAAAVSGGVWKTLDGGARWDAVGDLLANLTVNSLVMDPRDSKVLYAGTGEGFFREEQRGTALPLRGNGMYVTRDGGMSWRYLSSTAGENFHWVNDLVISAHDSSRIYAATRTGVWRSDNAGETWTHALPVTVKGGCLELALRPGTDGDYLFASCGSFQQATVYRNARADEGGTWTSVLSEPAMGRTTLAIAPSNPSVIYALSASNEPGRFYQGLLAVFRSESNGDPGSWNATVRNTNSDKLATLLLTNPVPAAQSACGGESPDVWITMGWYCNTIAVDPADPNRVWAGGVDLFRSDDGGRTWGLGSYWWARADDDAYVHADQHAVTFHPGYNGTSNRTMFAATDGGVYRTDDARASVAKGPTAVCEPANTKMRWRNLNTYYGATQFYHGAAFPDGQRYLGGAQDNGTVIGGVREGVNSWSRVFGGDGAYVAIDPVDPTIVYAESQNGRMAKSIDGGETFKTFPIPSDSFLFIAPFLLDQNAHLRVWLGGRSMWRSDAGDGTWVRAGGPFPSTVSAIAVAPGRSDLVLAGTNNGSIMRTTKATTATPETVWESVGPRAGFVSSLAFDPVDSNVAYATYAGFGGIHVWKSIDAGVTWSRLDGSGDGALPDIPVHSIAIDPTRRDRLYLGTDLGIFTSSNGGASWMIENSGFAAVVTEAVFIGRGAHGPAVYAFTHGRGAWRAELVTPPRRRVTRP